ncbi:TRAP transporter small permease [Nocardia rhamnosiphila]|uniref:TRAP transporter small permease n=1 Tax=Nocardia rhamnosiphila TaxID=426716 RepID=UPI0009DD70F3|nr:TRAP transporter small permease [Nocardia rhamnosiphila]
MSASTRAASARPPRLRLLIEVPAVIVLFVMMLHVTANALLRAFAAAPIQNTLEITQYIYLPIIALLGFMAAQARGEHIVADLVTHYFPRPVRRAVLGAGYLAALIVMAGFAWYGLEEALHARDIGQTAGVSTVVSWPVLFLVPLAFAVLAVQLGVAAVRALRGAEDADTADGIDDEIEAVAAAAAPTGTTVDSEKK